MGMLDEPTAEFLGWVEVDPEFGAAMPWGSCNAHVRHPRLGEGVCGYPRRADGTCLNGHPPPVVVQGEVVR